MDTDIRTEEMVKYVLPLDDEQATLERVGGKGASLARLMAARLPVPAGFHVTTDAYRAVVADNQLQPAIMDTLQRAESGRPSSLQDAATRIQALFANAELPPTVANSIVQAYSALPGNNPAVAVRSSATAEDLPEASFAGQQETYLNVSSPEMLLEATRKCWASLWTARAIGYRTRQRIPPEQVALAVVVQLLVPAEAAGILFTANPINGRRDQVLISAAWGLGEAVVGGLVTPDNLVVEKASGRVQTRNTAGKEVMTVRVNGGTVEKPVPDSLRDVPVLSDAAATELADLGVQIEELFQIPVDVEWALADGEFAIVQARPITALPEEEGTLRDEGTTQEPEPPREWPRPDPDGRYMRTSIIDFMPNPLSPLFATLGVSTYNDAILKMMAKVTESEKAPFPENLVVTIHDYAYMKVNFSVREWWALLSKLAPRLRELISQGPAHFRDVALPAYEQRVRRLEEQPVQEMKAREVWRDARELTTVAMDHLAILQVDTLGAAAGSEGLFTALYERWYREEGDPEASVFLMGYDTVPIRSEKSLYDLAEWVSAQPTLGGYLADTPTATVVETLTQGEVPDGVQPDAWAEWGYRLEAHQHSFGHLLYDLDFAEPVPAEDPAPLLETVKMYICGKGVNPHERQEKLADARERASEQLLARAHGLRGWVLRKAFGWAQAVAEVREDSIASIGLAYPRLRELLKELGRRLVETGAVRESTDIFWLEAVEVEARLDALDRGYQLESLYQEIRRRKAIRRSEARVLPPTQIPHSETYLGIPLELFVPGEGEHGAGHLKGVGASSGKVTGVACVLHGPDEFDQMEPGSILVAKLTTPAWTPLFAMASAIVTDIGGPLSHGSIVAREYGIPAVLGTGVATHRIESGTQLTVDGDEGIVVINSEG